jgi:hypothetical protein
VTVAELKLPKLPDRTPVKLTISILPDLNQALAEYAEQYHEIYGSEETVCDLIPYMLRSFLESDRGFVRARQLRSKAQ